MASVHDPLRADVNAFANQGALRRLSLECARLARIICERPRFSVGLAPVADDVAIPSVAIAIGRALAARSSRPSAVLDACGNWPSARLLAASAATEGESLATNWLPGDVAVLTPRSGNPRTTLAQVRSCLVDKSRDFRHLIVDLTGIDHRGERAAAFELLEATIVVARSGRTTSRQVERCLREIPDGRNLGVLLTGL